jgi:adsorption protein B
MSTLLALVELLRNELLLFAGIGLLIGGLDDLLLDILYGTRRIWRALTVYSRIPRMTAPDLPPAGQAGPIAVLVPAWDEAAVIGQMLRRTLTLWRDEDVQLFVGTYPNDRPTIDAVISAIAELDTSKITLVVNPQPGPTTKADCLNQLWQAMKRWEGATGRDAICVVLHDAEDVVHKDALRLMGMLAPRFALVQLPVLPLVSARSRWISGHYCDEFAEAHGKSLLVREALGAAVPSAGVGCGFNRRALGRIAAERGERPFDPTSLTEDYELGLALGTAGGRGILVRMRDEDGALIATREYFPDTLTAAVRQKARWTIGIALTGWDRLGWTSHWREAWMRLHDRRTALAALVLLAAYLGLVIGGALWLGGALGFYALDPLPSFLQGLLMFNALFLFWRLGVRMAFVWRAYGLIEALRSVPRIVIGNIIGMMAARRAFMLYLRHLRGQRLVWDKTAHRFPDEHSPEAA